MRASLLGLPGLKHGFVLGCDLFCLLIVHGLRAGMRCLLQLVPN